MQNNQEAGGNSGQFPSSSERRSSSSSYGLEMQRQQNPASSGTPFFPLYGLQSFQGNGNLNANGFQSAGGGDYYGKGMPLPATSTPPPGFHNAPPPTSYSGYGNGPFYSGYQGQGGIPMSSSSSSSAHYFQRTEDNNRNNLMNSSNSNNLGGLSSLGGGIKPLIDNIVGSMMGNGTYTHFGPAGGGGGASVLSQDFGPFQHQQQQQNVEQEMRRPQESPVMREALQGQAQSSSGRTSASSEKGENNNASRPHTPSKPSYSEVLAKNAATAAAITASQSGSTTPTLRKAVVVGASSAIKKEIPNGTRKPEGSTSSGNSSSCASLSSSPVTKPRSLPQTIISKLFASSSSSTGKENSGAGKARSSPQTTPTHQKKEVNLKSKAGEDRKILSSQNSDKPKRNSKGFLSMSGSHDFSDLNMDEMDEDGDWMTYTRRGRNSQPIGTVSSTSTATVTNNNNKVSSAEQEDPSPSPTQQLEVDPDSVSVDEEGFQKDHSVERKTVSSASYINSSSSSASAATSSTSGRKLREKEKTRSRKDGRNGMVRRVEKIAYLWAASLISAVAWLVKLITDVFTLSVSVGRTLVEDFCNWWITKAIPRVVQQLHSVEETFRVAYRRVKQNLAWRKWFVWKEDPKKAELKRNSEELLAALGPERNIHIANADETLKRLLSCSGQDPYTILGIRSDSSDETIRRYYKKQAVHVHPDKNLVVGAEEAFKILGRAFELIGEPSKRQEYHQKLLEAHAKEQVFGEIGKLIEQLRKKMEIATSSIRCTKCNLRHKKNKTDRPLFAARFCGQCKIHHAAREGELWAEARGWFGYYWSYYTCMDSHIWEINEWAKCQKKNLLHIKADSHSVMYRLVAGGGSNSAASSGPPRQDPSFHTDTAEDWDSLINNLRKSGGVGPPSDGFYPGGGNANSSATNGSARRKKGKRK